MDYQNLVSEAVNSISTFLSRRIASQDSRLAKSAITLAYWIKDYVRLLGKELSASSYRRYDRGCVVSVHLGFRIGHEEDGLLNICLIRQSQQTIKVAKMKSGSIALADQIVTVSKLRIYDPCSSKDLLYGIKVSDDTMNKLDEKIKQLYIG